MSEKLFEQFPGVSSKQWKQSIQAGLRGADYNETLLTSTPEGITIKPFYNAEDLEVTTAAISSPESWEVTQALFIDDVRIARGLILKSIAGGAEALLLSAASSFDAPALFEGLELKGISIYCNFSFLDPEFLSAFAKEAKAVGAQLHLGVDIIGHLASDGNWYTSNESDHAQLAKSLSIAEANSVVGVNIDGYGNAGANAVQQLAYGLAHTNEYLNHLSQESALSQLQLHYNWSIGANYFMEIAKFRAFRLLLDSLGETYGIALEATHLARPASRNKTIYDPNVNMLRTTTECMSAVLGGVNAVCNLPYDSVYHKSNEFGERISRNQLLILKHESYLDQVRNAADGAYYIEELTQTLAEKALELFKQLEASGGFVKALFDGTIQRKIKEQAAAEEQAFKEGGRSLLGTNLFPNQEEKIKQTVELYPFLKTEARKTILEPIISQRIAESHEKKRLDNE